MRDKVLLSGPRLKEKMNGVSLAFELLVRGFRERDMPCVVVDTAFAGAPSRPGAVSIRRLLETAVVIFQVWLGLLKCQRLYATMSTSLPGFWRDYLCVLGARLLGRRVIMHLHGGGFADLYNSQGAWVRRRIEANLRRIDQIIVLGELLKDQFRVTNVDIDGKLVVVPNGLTLGVEEPESVQRCAPRGRPVKLLYVSSLMASKGYLDVIKAVAVLHKKFPGMFEFDLCGGFADAITEDQEVITSESALIEYIEELGLSEAITYHGQVDGASKEKVFLEADVFLLPTYYPWEGQPLSIIEAMAYALPVVTTKHKGIPELVVDGENGVWVDGKSPSSIASAIQKIVWSGGAYDEMSRDARNKYLRNFTRDVHLKKLITKIFEL